METSQKVLLLLSLGCAGLFAWKIRDDWIHYNQMIDQIEGPFYICVIFRGCQFLIPAALFAFFAAAMYWSDHRKPKK